MASIIPKPTGSARNKIKRAVFTALFPYRARDEKILGKETVSKRLSKCNVYDTTAVL